MSTTDSLGRLVRAVLDHVADSSPGAGFEEPVRWGSAEGSVQVLDDPEDPGTRMLRVHLSVMRVPAERREAFYRRLLELNERMKGRAAFSVNAADVVSLTAARPVLDLDPSEVVDLILWTAEQADRFDDELLDEYGPGSRGARRPGSPGPDRGGSLR